MRDALANAWPAPLAIEEHSHAGMANRYVAGASGLPFAVLRGYAGTDLPQHTPTISVVTCPFTGEELAAVRALNPDVGIVHAQRADRRGNVQLWGIVGVQKEVVLASRRALVTVEEIVDELTPVPGAVVLPHWVVDAIAVARGGAPVLRAGLLRPRQLRLPRLGRDQPRPRRVPPVARGGGRVITPDEVMSVAAARALRDGQVCFVGSACRPRRPTSPAACTRPTWC